MKKLFTIISILCFSTLAWAQNYGFTTNPSADAGFVVNRDANNKYSSTMFKAIQSASMSFELISNTSGSSSFNMGFYTFDSNFNIINEKIFSDVGSSAGDVFNSQNFEANDTIGIWVEINGEKFYSVHNPTGNGAQSTTHDGWYIDSETGELIFAFETDSNTWKGMDEADIFIKISGNAPMPSGEPLPSSLASVLLLLPILFFLKNRRLLGNR